MTLRIAYDYQTFASQQYGGVSRYFYEIANLIADMGNKVEIIAPLYINEYFHNGCKVHPRGIKIPCLPKTVGIAIAFDAAVSRILIKPRRNLDIFHETYYSMIDCCPSSAKRVITVHDMIHEKFPSNFPKCDKTSKIKAYAVRRADPIICVSENTRRDLIELLDVPEEKTSVVYHGYALTSKLQVSDTPIVSQRPYILYVGNRSAGYKNYERMLRAYVSSLFLRNNFSIVCFGGGAASAGELALIKLLNIPLNNINYISGSDDVLASLYASAKVFVYPSMYEGFGLPPLEAMSFGCPVVCTNSSSLLEVAGDAAELFDPADETAMRVAIERVVSSSERSMFLVERGYERIERFSWRKCAQDTLDVYDKVLRS